MDQYLVYATAAIILGLAGSQAFRKSFDPFAPIWLFLTGYAQIYVVQAITCRDYALRARGLDLTTQANARALWALAWFLAVYYAPIGRWLASRLPRPPERWSIGLVVGISPFLIIWGLVCSGFVIRSGSAEDVSAEESLFRQFPFVMLVAANLLIVTGRYGPRPSPAITWSGVGVAAAYVVIWMFNGKRSHALIGVLTALCSFYVSKEKRPSKPVLAATAFVGCLVVALAIGWRGNDRYDRSLAGFVDYLGDFRLAAILTSLNVDEPPEGVDPATISHETLEYGGFLLMMDTVPAKSDYDYGASYLRLVSTFIPRVVWADKPFFGRAQWVGAWIAGSEFKRDATFTGPAIGILGAAQLNGGAWGTLILLACLALLLRTSYEFFRRYPTVPWVQAWWALTYYNAWLMTVNDDPFVWFYYIYGFAVLPILAMLWIYHKLT